MKICLVSPSPPFKGGWAQYTAMLYGQLKKTHQVKYFSFKRQYPSLLYPGKTDKDLTSRIKGAEQIIDAINPLTWLIVGAKIRKVKPDLVIFEWGTIFWALCYFVISFLAKLSNAKILFQCHNVLPHDKSFLNKFLTKIAFWNADSFIVHSKEDLKILKDLKPKAKVKQTLIPLFNVFKQKIRKLEAKKRLRLKNNVILFFGLIRKYKGLEYLIEAMPSVLRKIKVDLLIVGDFWDEKKNYFKKIRELGIRKNVRIIDEYVPHKDVHLYFTATDVVVLPYISATQSGIVPIAYNFNKPVIATKVGGLPDIVKNGKNGLLVPPKNAKALSRAIIRFFKGKKGKAFSKNIRQERDKYSWKRIIKIIEEYGTH